MTGTYSLPGVPLTEKSSVLELLSHNVTVGIGIEESFSARNTRFDIGWVSSGLLFLDGVADSKITRRLL